MKVVIYEPILGLTYRGFYDYVCLW